MFNYEWKQAFKKAYLDVQHQLNFKYTGQETIDADCQTVSVLMALCDRYLREREQERVEAGRNAGQDKANDGAD